MSITLTYENGTTEQIGIPSTYGIKLARTQYLGSWRPNGIVTKVEKTK